jgi:hypothetical protein
MLIRKQIMMSDWLDDYLNELSEVLHISYAELVRVVLCFGLCETLKETNPDYQMSVDVKKMAQVGHDSLLSTDLHREQVKQLIGNIYYDSRRILDEHKKRVKSIRAEKKKEN